MVWNNCTQYKINALEKIQIEAARIATGATKLVSYSYYIGKRVGSHLKKDNINLSYVSFFQMSTGVLPNYLSSLIPASVEDSTTYNLRNANNFRHTLS